MWSPRLEPPDRFRDGGSAQGAGYCTVVPSVDMPVTDGVMIDLAVLSGGHDANDSGQRFRFGLRCDQFFDPGVLPDV